MTVIATITRVENHARLKLSWTHALSGSASPLAQIDYIVRRNDIGCDWSFQQVGTAKGPPFAGGAKFQDPISPSMPRSTLYYRVQPVVELLGPPPTRTVWGPVSNCVSWP